MYGIANAGAKGSLLTLDRHRVHGFGRQFHGAGGADRPGVQPTTVTQSSDMTGLVNTGGTFADPVPIAVLESQVRISSGTGRISGGNRLHQRRADARPAATPGVTYPAGHGHRIRH